MANIRVRLPNGASFEYENAGLSDSQIAAAITAAGTCNLAGATAVRSVADDGVEELSFVPSQGASKAL